MRSPVFAASSMARVAAGVLIARSAASECSFSARFFFHASSFFFRIKAERAGTAWSSPT